MNFVDKYKNRVNELLSFFYPSYCPSCKVLINSEETFNVTDEVLCSSCLKKINPIVSYYLPITKTLGASSGKRVLKVYAASDYKNPLRHLILKKSYSDVLASRQVARLMLKLINKSVFDVDYIVPIPLHWTRRLRRGFNQTEVMANVIGKKLNIPVLNILKRNKKTKYQSSLSVELRAVNVKNAFEINKKFRGQETFILSGKKILLIDDLCTTGATLKNASKVFIKCKPKEIRAVVACRVV